VQQKFKRSWHRSVEGLKGTVVNLNWTSLNGRSFEIMLTVLFSEIVVFLLFASIVHWKVFCIIFSWQTKKFRPIVSKLKEFCKKNLQPFQPCPCLKTTLTDFEKISEMCLQQNLIISKFENPRKSMKIHSTLKTTNFAFTYSKSTSIHL